MCRKQTSFSHSSTEAEIISIDARLRMDGIPALDLWNLVKEVFHCDRNLANKAKAQEDLLHRVTSNTQKKSQTKAQPSTTILNCFTLTVCLRMSDFSSVAMLYVSEDNEAVIKMIIKEGVQQ